MLEHWSREEGALVHSGGAVIFEGHQYRGDCWGHPGMICLELLTRARGPHRIEASSKLASQKNLR